PRQTRHRRGASRARPRFARQLLPLDDKIDLVAKISIRQTVSPDSKCSRWTASSWKSRSCVISRGSKYIKHPIGDQAELAIQARKFGYVHTTPQQPGDQSP